MTDYKATPEQWHELERHSHSSQPWAPCILELRARFEVLEAASRARLIEIIRLTNAIARLVPDRNKFLTDTMADEDDAKPTPNDRQIRSSLVERVAIAISRCEDSSSWDDEAINWAPEARAAIREVAAWMTSNPDVYFPPALVFALEKEAE
jgi:hypothetical protein